MILLAPHNDDETLFAAYTCLRYQPLVLVCLRSFVEATWPDGPTWEERESETRAACEILGCEVEQLRYADDDPPWDALRVNLLSRFTTDRVFAPLPEEGGHPHHNAIGELARGLFPNVSFYATYTYTGGKSTVGTLVESEPGWDTIKREAMACYKSQAEHPYTQAAFNEWPIDEYLT